MSHRDYLSKEFILDCDTSEFTERQIYIIKHFGVWFYALVHGKIKPVTSKQKHFISLYQGRVEPEGEYEEAWFIYRRQHLYEQVIEIEKNLDHGDYAYQSVVNGYYKVACLGHKKAQQWLLDEKLTDIKFSYKMSRLDILNICKRRGPLTGGKRYTE